MGAYQRGNLGAGLGTAIGVPGQNALFNVVAYFFQARTQKTFKQRFGRETNGQLSFRFIRPGGGILVRGDYNPDDGDGNTFPAEPSTWEGQETTLVYTFDENRTITWPVVVDSFQLVNAQKENDLPGFEATLKVLGPAVYSDGWGTATVGGTVTKSDITLYDGETVYDPASVVLVRTQVTVIDFWTLSADTDVAVLARLTAAMTAAAIPSGMKQRPGTVSQDAPDGGVITLRFGLNDTNDDVLNPHITRLDDPSDLIDNESTTALNTTPGSANISGLVSRGIRYVKHNDGATQQIKEWGRKTTQEDFEFPRSPKITDLSTIPIRSEYSEAHVTSSATASNPSPASGYKLRFANRIQMTDAGKYGWKYDLGLTTPQEDEENASSVAFVDASGIGDYTIHGRIVATATTADPDSGSVAAGQVLFSKSTKEINDNAFHRSFVYKLYTPAQKIQFDGTSAGGDLLHPTVSTMFNHEIVVGTCLSSDTQAAIGDSLYGSAINDPYFKSVNARKLSPLVYVASYERVNEHILVMRGVPSHYDREIGCDATGVYMNIQQHFAVGSGQTRIRIGAYTVGFAVQEIVVCQVLTSISSGTNSALLNTSLEGRTNSNSSFLGYGAGTHLYKGSHYGYAKSKDGTSRKFAIFHHFVKKLAFGSGGVGTGWFTSRNPYNTVVTVAATISSDADTAISSVNSAWSVQTPAQADLSGLIT